MILEEGMPFLAGTEVLSGLLEALTTGVLPDSEG